MIDINISHLLGIAYDASCKIMEIYEQNIVSSNLKADMSPITLADSESNRIISEGLNYYYPKIPIISEENNIRKNTELFWCIDPLDGTKEFLRKNGEFTVNISLLKDKEPIVGVVSVPAEKSFYFAIKGKGAYKIQYGSMRKIKVRKLNQNSIKVGISRSHNNDETLNFLNKYNVEHVPLGSSLKFLLLAEGKLDFYPRFGTTCLWDIAASYVIIKEAGGFVKDKHGENDIFNFNNFKNNHFIAGNSEKFLNF